MLRILSENVEAHQVVLNLQGNIVGEWADLLERVCLDLSRTGPRVLLDLAGVAFIGRSGLGVLVRLGRTGIGIVGCSPLIADLLEQEGIEVGRKIAITNDGELSENR